jgi:hypothetical protein
LAYITRQHTKNNYVVSQLNQQQAAKVEDIINSPPEQEPFERLNAVLVRLLSTSRIQRVRQHLSHEEMGDRDVWSLAPQVLKDFLRTIWASPLRTFVQVILAGQTVGSVCAQPPTWLRVFPRLLPYLPQRASPLRHPTIQSGY